MVSLVLDSAESTLTLRHLLKFTSTKKDAETFKNFFHLNLRKNESLDLTLEIKSYQTE